MNTLRELDPRTLIFTTAVLVSVSLLGGGDLYTDAALAVVYFCLLSAASLWKIALCGFLALLLVHLSVGLASVFATSGVAESAWLLASVARKVAFIGWSAVLLVSSISVGDCIRSLEKMRMPWAVVLPLAICVRVLPTLQHEGRIILDAMRIRGLCSSRRFLRHPLGVTELFLMTFLFRIMAIAEELAFSASTRAVSGNRKAWFREKKLTARDAAFGLLVPAIVVLVVLVPWQPGAPLLP